MVSVHGSSAPLLVFFAAAVLSDYLNQTVTTHVFAFFKQWDICRTGRIHCTLWLGRTSDTKLCLLVNGSYQKLWSDNTSKIHASTATLVTSVRIFEACQWSIGVTIHQRLELMCGCSCLTAYVSSHSPSYWLGTLGTSSLIACLNIEVLGRALEATIQRYVDRFVSS